MYHDKRYRKSIDLVKRFVPEGATILDLGNYSILSRLMMMEGYTVVNTKEDLDWDNLDYSGYHWITSFEVFEHLLNPAGVLLSLHGTLITTVPFDLWFSRAYRGPHSWDEHFHEFEDWQFDKLLTDCGWEIIHREYWYYGMRKLGIRPFLRLFWPSYYAVVARRK